MGCGVIFFRWLSAAKGIIQFQLIENGGNEIQMGVHRGIHVALFLVGIFDDHGHMGQHIVDSDVQGAVSLNAAVALFPGSSMIRSNHDHG